MSQSDFGTLNPGATNGLALKALLEGFRSAVHTIHRGDSRPDYAVAGMLWVDNSGTPNHRLLLFDGSDDILLVRWNTANNARSVEVPAASAYPLTEAPLALWVDTDGGEGLLLRDVGNAAWVTLGEIVGASWQAYAAGSPVTAAGDLLGEVRMFVGGTPPAQWALCDGAALSRTTYAPLFAVVGTAFGPGDGFTTFNLPNLLGRSPVGGGTGAGLTPRSPGSTGGADALILTLAELPEHAHGIAMAETPSGSGFLVQERDFGSRAGIYSETVGGGEAWARMPPYFVTNFIIRVEV